MSWLGKQRVRLESCASTNDEAARLADQGAPHGTVVTASAQTAGKGRQGRSWHSPPGDNLYMSCIVRPSLPAGKIPQITLAAGVGVCDAVNFYGATASLKWPNDVLVGRRKIAGILTEMSSQAQIAEHVVLGIGLNVRSSEFPDELSEIATSLRIATGRDLDVEDVAQTVLARLEPRLDALLGGDFDAIRTAWLERADLPRDVVTETVSGRAADLAESGALIVIDDDGQRHEIVSGDVTYRWGEA